MNNNLVRICELRGEQILSVLSLVRIGIIHPSQAMHGLDSGVRHDTTPADGDDRIMAGALTPRVSEQGKAGKQQGTRKRETRSASLSLSLSVLLVEVRSHLTLKCSTLSPSPSFFAGQCRSIIAPHSSHSIPLPIIPLRTQDSSPPSLPPSLL